jgi:hypothetical protein
MVRSVASTHQPLHDPWQVAPLRRLQQQMQVIGHGADPKGPAVGIPSVKASLMLLLVTTILIGDLGAVGARTVDLNPAPPAGSGPSLDPRSPR